MSALVLLLFSEHTLVQFVIALCVHVEGTCSELNYLYINST